MVLIKRKLKAAYRAAYEAYKAYVGVKKTFRATYVNGGLFIECNISLEGRSRELVIPFGTPFVLMDKGMLIFGIDRPQDKFEQDAVKNFMFEGGNYPTHKDLFFYPFFDDDERNAVTKALSGKAAWVKRKIAAAFAAGVFAVVIVASLAGGGDAPAANGDQAVATSGPTIGPEALLDNSIQFGAKDAAPEKTLYVFTDPQCPYCKEFDRTLASLGAEWSVRVLPVGFKPGSMQMSDAALCAKDPAQAWKYTIQGRSVNESASQACSRSAKKNTEAFAMLGMTSTPSTLRGDGKLFEGAVSKAELESPAL